MNALRLSVASLAGLLLVFTGRVAAAAEIPSDIPLPKDFKLPASLPVAIYLPDTVRDQHASLAGSGDFESGETMGDLILEAAGAFFTEPHLVQRGEDRNYALAIALHPEAKFDGQTIRYTMHYKVFAPDGQSLADGDQVASFTFSAFSAGENVLGKLSQRTAVLSFADVVSRLRPDLQKYPATGTLKDRSIDFMARKDRPMGSGTGFYFNAAGQLLTAAHVTRHCVAIEVTRDDKVVPADVVAHSDLLDIAVLDTHAPATQYLKFRRGETYDLGETITTAGYPLQPVLAAKPTLTRGNISSQSGLAGSVGQLQFSAPIQPGSSGGPLVSESGEVLGFAVGTLNGNAIAEPTQNVNFALEARYAAQFLRRHNLSFDEVDAGDKGDLHTATNAALGAIASVKCYE